MPKFPTIAAVTHALRDAAKGIAWPVKHRRNGDTCDVRLQVYPSGAWALRVGPSDYDLDHRGAFASTMIPRGRFNARDLARTMLEGIRDVYAEQAAYAAGRASAQPTCAKCGDVIGDGTPLCGPCCAQ